MGYISGHACTAVVRWPVVILLMFLVVVICNKCMCYDFDRTMALGGRLSL